jgi:hypothetical protein
LHFFRYPDGGSDADAPPSPLLAQRPLPRGRRAPFTRLATTDSFGENTQVPAGLNATTDTNCQDARRFRRDGEIYLQSHTVEDALVASVRWVLSKENPKMTLRNYFLLSVGIFVLAVAGLRYLPIPILPFVLIILIGETLLGFQVEDHKVGRLLLGFLNTSKHHAPPSAMRHD